MRIDRVCVRRLKTFEYYGNAAVELCAQVDENDKLDDVVRFLQVKVEALVDAQKEISKLEEYKAALEREVAEVKRLQEELRSLYEKISDKWREVHHFLDELEQIDEKVENARGILQRLKEKLRGAGS